MYCVLQCGTVGVASLTDELREAAIDSALREKEGIDSLEFGGLERNRLGSPALLVHGVPIVQVSLIVW